MTTTVDPSCDPIIIIIRCPCCIHPLVFTMNPFQLLPLSLRLSNCLIKITFLRPRPVPGCPLPPTATLKNQNISVAITHNQVLVMPPRSSVKKKSVIKTVFVIYWYTIVFFFFCTVSNIPSRLIVFFFIFIYPASRLIFSRLRRILKKSYVLYGREFRGNVAEDRRLLSAY